MGLPRGRRWVEQRRAPSPSAGMHLQRIREQLAANDEPIADPLARREELWRASEACRRRQGELLLRGEPPSEAST